MVTMTPSMSNAPRDTVVDRGGRPEKSHFKMWFIIGSVVLILLAVYVTAYILCKRNMYMYTEERSYLPIKQMRWDVEDPHAYRDNYRNRLHTKLTDTTQEYLWYVFYPAFIVDDLFNDYEIVEH